jgi:hypothetical protein
MIGSEERYAGEIVLDDGDDSGIKNVGVTPESRKERYLLCAEPDGVDELDHVGLELSQLSDEAWANEIQRQAFVDTEERKSFCSYDLVPRVGSLEITTQLRVDDETREVNAPSRSRVPAPTLRAPHSASALEAWQGCE